MQLLYRANRGAIEIENPEAGVMIQSRGCKIAVRPHKPIGDDYAIQNKDGAVDLVIPDGSAVDVHGYVGRGRIQTNLPLVYYRRVAHFAGRDGSAQWRRFQGCD